jgi:hypothetical protein
VTAMSSNLGVTSLSVCGRLVRYVQHVLNDLPLSTNIWLPLYLDAFIYQ